MTQLLTECQLFKDMTEASKEKCMQSFHYQIKKFSKGDSIVQAHEVVIQQLIIIRGSVKSEMMSYNGKTIKIADMVAPRILAPGFLFGKQSHYPVSIQATSDCEVLAISKEYFLETILMDQQLQLNFINLISDQTQFLTRKINFLNFKTIKGKIAYFLFTLLKRQKQQSLQNVVVLPQSQTQLAELFGVTRPSLSRAMNELSHDGMIKIEGKRIEIIDIAKLKTFLD